MDKPRIVCLCGSTRFTSEMMILSWEFSKQGCIVLSWNALPDGYSEDGVNGAEAEGVKEQIDELHKRKIDLADDVFVINIDNYIGESTQSEIDYAIKTNKPVIYMENWGDNTLLESILKIRMGRI